jgi:hypothetical protein
MELLLKREIRSKESTIGRFQLVNANGHNEDLCFILEDFDRGLKDSMSLDEIQAAKVYGKTAIPAGRYRIVISYSNKFQKYLPEIIGVKGYEGIRIHSGNTAADTEGCLLTGSKYGVDIVTDSRKAFNYVFALLQAVNKTEKMYITIQ